MWTRIAIITVVALPWAAHAQPYQPLRGSAPPQRLLTWAGKDAALRGAAPGAPAPVQPLPRGQAALPYAVSPRPQAPPPLPPPQIANIYEPPQAARPIAPMAADPARMARGYGAAAPPAANGDQMVRRYSVGREFGVEPDRIAMPKASVLAFSPEVGAAFAAQKDDISPPSPADLDLIEQANQDDQRREARQKARDKAAAANN